jgi:hypothetical protein
MSFVASTASNFKSQNHTATTDVAGCRVVNVAITTLDASGDAHHNYVQQDTVTIADIDYQFDISLNLAQSCVLLNCFDISGNGPYDGFKVELAGEAKTGVSGQAALAAIIADALDAQAATGAAGSWAGVAKGGSTLNDTDSTVTMLEKDLWQGLVDVLRSDGLINTVEDVLLRSEVKVSIKAADAAAVCAAELKGSDAHRNILFTQLPNSNFMLYKDMSENTTTGALPMKDGDILTFVFDCDMLDVVPTSQAKVPTAGAPAAAVNNAAPGGGSGATAAAPPGYDPTANLTAVGSGLVHYNMGKKRIALNLQVRNPAGAASAAFPVSALGAGLEPSKLRAATFRGPYEY